MQIETKVKDRNPVAAQSGPFVYLPFKDGAACIEISPEGVSIVAEPLHRLLTDRELGTFKPLFPGDSITLNL